MNRLDLKELMQEVQKELTMKGGNFDELFGLEEDTLKKAEFITAVALTAVDKYYTKLTKDAFLLREKDEHIAPYRVDKKD